MDTEWLKQFENETLLARLVTGEIFIKTGTPIEVELTEEEFALIKGASIRHTHTTSIGGTFSKEDIWLTVDAKSPSHTVLATISNKKFMLERTAAVDDLQARRFAEAFEREELSFLHSARESIWTSEYEPYELPLDNEGMIKAEVMVKSHMHKWLCSNASAYGFIYSFS